jgi:hypothetical protein
MGFDSSPIPYEEIETVDSLVDPKIQSRFRLRGISSNTYFISTGFDVHAAEFDALESWLVAQHPGLEVGWGCDDP